MNGEEDLVASVVDAFKPVHHTLAAALFLLADRGVTGRTYFTVPEHVGAEF